MELQTPLRVFVCLFLFLPAVGLGAEAKSSTDPLEMIIVVGRTTSADKKVSGGSATIRIEEVISGPKEFTNKALAVSWDAQPGLLDLRLPQQLEVQKKSLWIVTKNGENPVPDLASIIRLRPLIELPIQAGTDNDREFDAAVSWGRSVEELRQLPLSERKDRLRVLVTSTQELTATWALVTFCDIYKYDALPLLQTLTKDFNRLPIQEQLVIDERMTELDSARWNESDVRKAMYNSLSTGRVDEVSSYRIVTRFNVAMQQRSLSDADAAQLLGKVILNSDTPIGSRKLATQVLTRVYRRPSGQAHAFDVISGLLTVDVAEELQLDLVQILKVVGGLEADQRKQLEVIAGKVKSPETGRILMQLATQP